MLTRQVRRELCDHGFADDVDGVDGVSVGVVIDRRQRVEVRAFGRATIASRTRSCMARIGASSTRGSRMRLPVRCGAVVRANAIMDVRQREQFGRFRLGPRIAQKVTAADFWAGEILQGCGLRSGGWHSMWK